MARRNCCYSSSPLTLTVVTVVLVATLVLVVADASPWFDLFVGGGGGQRSFYPNRSPTPRSRSGRDRYKSICRSINADNYAFPGRIPFPSAPLCPY